MRIRLDARLSAVLSLIREGETLCDVGTDHGKLPVAALLSGRVKSAIATDVSDKSLSKARLLAEREGVPLRCLCGDGLTPLHKGEADVAVIAGMGGAEIVKILQNASFRPPRVILVPHRDAPLVRRYLRECNACITHDIAVKEGKHFYFVIEADLRSPWRDGSVYFGREGSAFEEYRAARLAKIDSLLALKQDPSLREEKEELSHAFGLGDTEQA